MPSAAPAMRILMLSMHRDEQFFLEALRVGAAGYVVKSAADRDLIGACRAVMRGETFLYSDAQHLLLRLRAARRRASASCPTASRRCWR